MKKLLLLLFFLPIFLFSQNWNNDYYTNWSIIGWSKTGYVALFESHEYDLMGGGRYTLLIQNIKTDQIVDVLTLCDDKDDYGCESYDSLTLIRKNNNQINRLLQKYQIIENHNNKFYNLTYTDNLNSASDFYSEDVRYSLAFFWDRIHNFNEDCNLPHVMGYSLKTILHVYVNIYDKYYGSKHVSSMEAPECSDGYYCLGYFKSPYENRILLAFKSSIQHESEFMQTDYIFVGCSLDPTTFNEEIKY